MPRLPAESDEERSYLAALVSLAEGKLHEAESFSARLLGQSQRACELRWRIAHARKDGERIGAAARQFCAASDTTGRSCVDAELYAVPRPRPEALIENHRLEVQLSPTAPVPALPAVVGGEANTDVSVGAVLDTGASGTVVASRLAARLGLVLTERSFPIAVAAGGGLTKAQLGILPSLKIGSAVVKNLPVLVVDLQELERLGISVILSPQQAFDGFRFSIDLTGRRFVVDDGPPSDEGVPYLQVGFDLAVRATVGTGPSALFGLDTGLDGAIAISDLYAVSSDEATATNSGDLVHNDQELTIQGAGATSVGLVKKNLRVDLGVGSVSRHVPGVVTQIPRTRPFQLSGFLGNALWGERPVVVDTRTRRIFFSFDHSH